MKRYVLHETFNIYQFKASTWQHPVHNHTYHEIIFILKGSGKHHINGSTSPYATGDVFLLGPDDYHHFDITRLTEFCYIRFQDSFSQRTRVNKDLWQSALIALLKTPNQGRGSLVKDAGEKQKLFSLLRLLQFEYEMQRAAHYEVMVDNLLQAILVILARNAVYNNLPPIRSTTVSLDDLLMYIRKHIHAPELLSIEHLADKFNYAPNYLSIYFKKHTGEALKQFVVKQRIKLIEARLLYSAATLTEIADEFGYADESHLCKQFKKYTGYTPKQFRMRA